MWNAPVGGGSGMDFNIPPEGMFDGILAGIIDKGYRLNTYDKNDPKIQRKIHFAWALDAYDEENEDEQYFVLDWLTFSMHERAKMRQRIENALNKTLSDEQAKTLDVNKLIGKLKGQILIEHSENGEYANVKNVMPLRDPDAEIEIAENVEEFLEGRAKDYRKSVKPNFDDPAASRPLSDAEIEYLHEQPDSIREDLVAAIEAVEAAAVVAGDEADPDDLGF